MLAWSICGASAHAAEGASPPLAVSSRVYDLTQLLASNHVPDDVRKGRALWLQRCAYCHDGVGQPTYRTMGPWLGAETVQSLGEEGVRALIGAGTVRMPGFRYALGPHQVDLLIAFLKSQSSDQKPTPAQLAASSSGAAVVERGE
jgi:mono/diheme cytochrome c family protein